MRKQKTILTILLLLFIHLYSFAWEIEAHKITGTVALNYLEQKSKDSIQLYLGGMTLQEAAAWMDQVKSDPSYEYLRSLHFINFEKGEKYTPNSKGNIINELNTVITELKERNKYSKEQIALDLKILCHLIGDLHHPLHCGYAVDRGGNNVQVSFLNKPTNLHRIWDLIIQQYSIAAVDCIKNVDHYSEKDLTNLQQIDVVNWMNESRAILPTIYSYTNNKIGNDYSQKNISLIEKQLGLSGFRLANILNEIFAK